MDNFLLGPVTNGNCDEFEDDENDSDLEGRLYAEIYFSNEIHEIEDNYNDSCMKTIEQIKNASRSDTPTVSKLTTNTENPENEIINKDVNLPENDKFDKTTNEQIKNGQNENNTCKKTKNTPESSRKLNTSLTTPKSAKRKSKTDKDFENRNKRRSIESNGSNNINYNNCQLNPIYLNSKKQETECNDFPPISDKAMDILFPEGWKNIEPIELTAKKPKVRMKKKAKLNKNNSNESENETKKSDVIVCISSDDDSDIVIGETPKKVKQNKIVKNNKQLPDWLTVSSDSEESILEVPVPPKPSPPVVEVKDTDCEISDSSDGIYDLNSPRRKEQQTKGVFTPKSENISDNSENSSHNSENSSEENDKPSEVTIDISDSSSSRSSENEQPDVVIEDNLILNCTLPKSREITDAEYNEYFEPLKETNTSKTIVRRTVSKITYKSSKEQTDEEYFFSPMPEKIKAYYDNSWGGEKFSIEEIRSKMSKNPKHWTILEEDWNPNLIRRQRYFLTKGKCNNCRQPGHYSSTCPKVTKTGPVCHMCGAKGHYETRCPHKICLTCGKKQSSYRKTCESCNKMYCNICSARGHTHETCPDLWRRYHHTTRESEYRSPTNSRDVMKPSQDLFCCNCTKRGHDAYNCTKYRWSEHHPTPSRVKNYNIYNEMGPGPSNSREESNTSRQSSQMQNYDNDIEEEDCQSDVEECQSEEDDPIEEYDAVEEITNTKEPKIIFDCKLNTYPKMTTPAIMFDETHKSVFILNNIKGANLKNIINRRTDFSFWIYLSKILKCEFSIIAYEGSRVEMTVTYYILFSDRKFMKKIIDLWVRIPDREKLKSCMVKLPSTKNPIQNVFQKRYKELARTSRGIEERIDILKEKTAFIKENLQTPGSKISKKRTQLTEIVTLLVPMLYEQGCGADQESFADFKRISESLRWTKEKHIQLNIYLRLFYYLHLIFPKYTPPDIAEMVNKYYAKTGSNKRVSYEEIVYVEDENFIQRENSFQKKPKEQNSDSSEQPSSSRNSISMLSSPRERNNVFASPAKDFISIETRDDVERTNLRDQRRISGNLRHNNSNSSFQRETSESPPFEDDSRALYAQDSFPPGQYKMSDNRREKTRERLKNDATKLMNKALALNIPHITKAAIRVGNLITNNRLYRKHIQHLETQIKRQTNKKKKKFKNNTGF